MSLNNRGFFELRYSVPGYTFILVIAVININLLFIFMSQAMSGVGTATFAGIVLALVAFLGGVPFGFLVSQVWYFILYAWMFPTIVTKATSNETKRTNFIEKKLKLSELGKHYQALHSYHKVKDEHLKTVYDYIYYNQTNATGKKTPILEYLIRRWDLFNVLGATTTALISALVVGNFIYFYFLHVVNFPIISNSAVQHYFDRMNIVPGVPMHIVLIILISIILLASMLHGMFHLAGENVTMSEVAVKNYDNKALRKVFGDDCFYEKEHNNDKYVD
jgi:hypothetical protein